MQSNQAAVTSVVIRRNDDVLFVQAFDDDVCLCIVSAAHCKSVSLLCHALGKLSETLVLYGRSYRTTFNCVLQQYFERVLSKVCWGRSAVVTMVFDLPFYYTECCLHHAFHCAEIVI